MPNGKEGVQKGIWIYYLTSEGMGYGELSPTPVVEISEEATLYRSAPARLFRRSWGG